MPQVRWCRAGDKGVSDGQLQGVERTGAIAPDDHPLRLQVLRRTTSGVKFNRAIVIGGKLAHRDKILNKSRRNKNIIKSQRSKKRRGASSSDG